MGGRVPVGPEMRERGLSEGREMWDVRVSEGYGLVSDTILYTV